MEQIEPFGEYGHYLRTGIVAATLANIHRSKDQRAFTPQDFMPTTFLPPHKPQDTKTFKQIMMAIMERQNAIMKMRGVS